MTDLFALGMRDCQGPFDGFRINVRSVNLFPEHVGKLLDLRFCPIDEGYPIVRKIQISAELCREHTARHIILLEAR